MNIPIVNASVTDRNRKQTQKICGFLGYEYRDAMTKKVRDMGDVVAVYPNGPCILISNGSFTLDQVVGMLEAEGVIYQWDTEHPTVAVGCYFNEKTGFVFPVENVDEDGAYLCEAPISPHDLTAALDALIKVLEAKP